MPDDAQRSCPKSAPEVGADLSRLVVREAPARVRHRLPALVAQPLADGALALAEFGARSFGVT